FVLPSVRSKRGDEETQGLVVQEAQANGLPVVVSDVGGIREGIAENESGLVFRAGDVDHSAKVLRGLIQRKDQWPEMGRAGRRLVEERYASDVLVRRLLACYERA